MANGRDRDPLYSISVTARLIGTTPRTLRIYEEADLISPFRTEGKTRLYSKNDLARLHIIYYFHKEREVNLPGIKILLQFISCEESPAGPGQNKRGELKGIAKIREIAPELAARLEKQ